MAASIISTASLTFGDSTYKVKSLPGAKSKSCEAVEVTTLSDTKKQFVPGALTTNADVQVEIAGDILPEINTKAALTLTVGATTISFTNAVVSNVEPKTLTTSNGDREVTATVTFKPCGEDPANG